MTKEQIKDSIDNINVVCDEIIKRFESLGKSTERLLEEITEENIENLYNEFNKYCPDILKEYNFDLDKLKIGLVFNADRITREQILGKDEANQLLRDIIDIYGDEAYSILGCNYNGFEMSEIDGILSGENNKKYEEFYTKLLNQKCEKAYSLENLSEILLSVKPQYINQRIIENFLNTPNRKISWLDIHKFINMAPTIITNGEVIKLLVERAENIGDYDQDAQKVIIKIPPELYDEKFAKSLLEKAGERQSLNIFNLIPDKIKTRDICEYAVTKNNGAIFNLPSKKIDKKMTDEEYSKWCENLVLKMLRANPEKVTELFGKLQAWQKTPSVCYEATNLLPAGKNSGTKFLEMIPENCRTRKIYEVLSEKDENTIKSIPLDTFEEGVSQEEYDFWLEDVITRRISQTKNVEELNNSIPRKMITERVWNALIDRCNETGENKEKFDLSIVPIQNITINVCERALRDIGDNQIKLVPSVDRKTDEVKDKEKRQEYKKWQSSLSKKEKQKYREWYERKVIEYIEKNYGAHIFTDRFDENIPEIKIPTEAITINMIKTLLNIQRPVALNIIPMPNDLTNYNEQYEDIVVLAISMLKDSTYKNGKRVWQREDDKDYLKDVPEEYRTDRVILEAIKKHPKYLEYADKKSEKFNEFLQIAYKEALDSLGKKELSEQEIELMKKLAKNNSSLFSTLDIRIINLDIINSIGESSLERIVRYINSQEILIELAEDKDALTTFGFALENLKQDNLFVEPLIEKLGKSIGIEKEKNKITEATFLKFASDRIQDRLHPLTEEEKIIISYLALNSEEAKGIKSYADIANFITIKNNELDQIMNSQSLTLIDAKNAYFERTVGMSYTAVLDLVTKYGNDPEKLLARYEGKKLETYKEKSERESLEIVIRLKSLIDEENLEKIKEAYGKAIKSEDKTKAFERYKQSTILDNALRRAYGRDIIQSLNVSEKENNEETVEYTQDGQKYVVRRVHGPFNRMVSVMDAYRKSSAEAEDDMYERWNTSKMANNHALCYSFINESNPGTALIKDGNAEVKKGIIISVNKFDAEALTAAAPYDLQSDSKGNTTTTKRQQRFYTANDFPDQTRGNYSEFVIEIQDVAEGVTGYKKIQPTSIICFEEIDEDSVKAAIELSKKLGRTIPIELIDRRELASQEKQKIDNLMTEFRNGDSLQPELVRQIITRFNNVRNAHMNSSLSDELLGENPGKENPEAIFNKTHLNGMILECIEIAKKRIEAGKEQEGLETIALIKQFIRDEREKNKLMPTEYEKMFMAGISLDIDCNIDEIQRMYGRTECITDKRNVLLDVLQSKKSLESPTFETVYGDKKNLAEQMPFNELQRNIDIAEIRKAVEEIHQKGYYSKNKVYSEEYVTRVVIFANAIANLEGADEKTKRLLQEAVKYHSCGRMIDSERIQYQEYSAKIAGQELSDKFSKTDVGIVQASIELQNYRYSSSENDERKNERQEKIEELCKKYGLDISCGERIGLISQYIEDSINLDRTRFLARADIPPEEVFSPESLQTETAKKLIKASYCMQDELATEHLKTMSKVATVSWEYGKSCIRNQMFPQKINEIITPENRDKPKQVIYKEGITESPIAQEIYFRYRYPEIDFDSLIEVPEKQEVISEQCIAGARNIAETRRAQRVKDTINSIKDAYREMQNPDRDSEERE